MLRRGVIEHKLDGEYNNFVLRLKYFLRILIVLETGLRILSNQTRALYLFIPIRPYLKICITQKFLILIDSTK